MDTSEFDEAYEDDTSRREAEERKLGEKILGASLRALNPKPAVTMPETTPIEDAVRMMLDQKIGAVLVTKDARRSVSSRSATSCRSSGSARSGRNGRSPRS